MRGPESVASCPPVKAVLVALAVTLAAVPASAVPPPGTGTTGTAGRPVVLVQAGHLSPGEPGYLAQTGASGNPFGPESEFTRRVRDDMVRRLRAAGIDARPVGARVEPLGVAAATFISVHHDSPGGAAMVGHAEAGGNENYYRGQGFGTAQATPYPDSAPHRRPATTVSKAVQRTSTRTAERLAAALGRVFTRANGARGRFHGVVPPGSQRRMNHFYGFYRTTAASRVIVEAGAAPEDNLFLGRTATISRALSDAVIADLRGRHLL